MKATTITSVRLFRLTGTLPHGTPAPWPQVRPASVYDDLHRSTAGVFVSVGEFTTSALYLEIGTSAGVTGRYGPLHPDVAMSMSGIAKALLGLDPMAGNYIWDLLERSDPHSRHGSRKIAISAVDNVLWDLRGRLTGLPVWKLMGGGGRDRVPAYASALAETHGEGEVEQVAAALLDEGFPAIKWFFSDGPGQGADGMERNVSVVERARAAVGERVPLMFDAFMGWDLAYAREWCQRVEHLRPAWLEEPFAPMALTAFAQLRASTSVPIATGEHLYDRREILPFLEQGLLAALQVDPEWCGGMTEIVRMCAIAEAYDVPLNPHAGGLHAALHTVASQPPAVSKWIEWSYKFLPDMHHFEIDSPVPFGGSFALPERPGFGIELDHSLVEASADLVAIS